jgi:hypothetical protein
MTEFTLELEKARLHEAERRLALLGDLIDFEYNHAQLRDGVRAMHIPCRTLRKWIKFYRQKGELRWKK